MHLMFKHWTVRFHTPCCFIAGNGEHKTYKSHGFYDFNSCLSSILHELILITANVKYSMKKVYRWISQKTTTKKKTWQNPKKREYKKMNSALRYYFNEAHFPVPFTVMQKVFFIIKDSKTNTIMRFKCFTIQENVLKYIIYIYGKKYGKKKSNKIYNNNHSSKNRLQLIHFFSFFF